MEITNRYKKIDNVKLENFIMENFLTKQSFCDTIGRSDSWLHESLKRKSMSMTDIMAIKGAHGLDILAPREEEVKEKDSRTEDISEIKDLLTRILAGINKTNEYLNTLNVATDTVNVGMDIIFDNQEKMMRIMQAKNNQRPVVNITKSKAV